MDACETDLQKKIISVYCASGLGAHEPVSVQVKLMWELLSSQAFKPQKQTRVETSVPWTSGPQY